MRQYIDLFEDEQLEVFVDIIKNECSQFLNEAENFPLYTGNLVKTFDHREFDSMPMAFQIAEDDERHGWKELLQTLIIQTTHSAFADIDYFECYGDIRRAKAEFGDKIYYLFPKDGYQYAWVSYPKDFYEFAMKYIGELDDSLDVKDTLMNHKMQEILSTVQIVGTHLNQARNTGRQIFMNCPNGLVLISSDMISRNIEDVSDILNAI